MNEKILVIEDDPNALRFIEYTLEQEGYQVLSAKDGLEGIKKARDEHPSLIVLDIMLPGLDGYALCQRLRQNDYLTKPADPAVIIAKVKALLAGTSQIISKNPDIEKSQS